MTKKFLSFFTALVLVLSLAAVSLAKDDKVTLTGYVVDKACKDNAKVATGEHSKGCSLSERCAKSGYGVYSDGKFTEFDEKGASLAKAALEKSAKDKGAKFKVTGMLHDGKLMVESIDEVE